LAGRIAVAGGAVVLIAQSVTARFAVSNCCPQTAADVRF
jgi:hypothetical protein